MTIISETKLLAECLEIQGRFRRSIHLEKDFSTDSQNGDYFITPVACETLRRLVEGLGNESPFRAWTITGPYGVGKSAFAVFLTRLLCSAGAPGQQARKQLEQSDPTLYGQLSKLGLFADNSKGFLAVLTTARRTPAPNCILESILAAAESTQDRKVKASVQNLAQELSAKGDGLALDTRRVVQALTSLSEAAQASGYTGLLLIVDELGKLFEYAARYPQNGDVYVLQELAEQAARSNNHPIVFVGVLHQSFQEYGSHLDSTTRREWSKIQGRFEDVAFLEPADQVIRMIARAIRWSQPAQQGVSSRFLTNLAAEAANAGVVPPGMRKSDFEYAVEASYPLHPIALVALPFLFRRFAQNERSLFSYLNSFEPHGFQEFIRTHALSEGAPPLIRLGNLFDYFTRGFGAGLYRHPQALRWMEAADILERKDELSPLHREVIKTTGILNALGEFCHLSATEEILSLAVSDVATPGSKIQEALRSLRDASIITYRKFNHTFRIWEGSDVDIDERIAEGERKIRRGLNLAESVRRYLPPRPIVARRHSFETGALRSFAIEYVDDPETLPTYIESTDANGKVLVCLAESPAAAEQFLTTARQTCDRQDLLFAIPQLIGELRSVVTELGALRWAWDNTPQLRDDRVARREISLRIAEADQLLQRSVDGLLDPRGEPAGSKCRWVHVGQLVAAKSPVEVSQLLSNICDKMYDKSPWIRNELIARHSLSAASVGARRNLVERMLSHGTEEALGIQGYPPERSMYESVLKASGLHRCAKAGNWGFHSPDAADATRITPTWDYLRTELLTKTPRLVQINDIFAKLSAPPYGVPSGLHPILLCAFLLIHPDETTLYREGTFLPEPGIADFEVLMRRPELFSVAGSRISGGRKAVVHHLAENLKVNPATVPVVRALFQMVKALPAFALSTRQLPDMTIAVRAAFQIARSPEQFLFVALPEALGLTPFSERKCSQSELKTFWDLLKKTLRELSEAAPNAISTARDCLLTNCGIKAGEEHWADLRHLAISLEPTITEPRLLTFLRRVAQCGADGPGIESVLALVANRPPQSWADADVERFPEAAAATGRAFQEAARSSGLLANSRIILAKLPPKERRQAKNLHARLQRYLQRNANETAPRALRAAVTLLLEDLKNE